MLNLSNKNNLPTFLSIIIALQLLALIHTELTIISPEELGIKLNNAALPITYANFGKIPYNFYSRGIIFRDTTTVEENACWPLDDDILPNAAPNIDYFPIIIARRGQCSFVTKARHIQERGASMAIIVNNQPGPIDHIILADDGTGSDINIPTFMVTAEVGEMIIEYMKAHLNSEVVMEVDFKVQKTDKVQIDFFFNSYEQRAYTFLDNLWGKLVAFEDKVEFIPHYIVFKSPFYKETKPEQTENCVSKGKYCAWPKSTSLIKDGRAVILEDLRQKCLFNISKEKNKLEDYFNYLGKVNEVCLNITIPELTTTCSKEALGKANLPFDYVNDCVQKSFGISNLNVPGAYENDNTILEEEYQTRQLYYWTSYPALFINNHAMSGIIKENEIMDSICSIWDDKSELCETYKPTVKKEDTRSIWAIVGIIAAVVVINVIIVMLCRRYINRRVHESVEIGGIDIDGRINNVVSNYFSLKESK